MEAELARQDYFVVEFVPPGQCSELGTREVGDRAEIESVDSKSNKVTEIYENRSNREGSERATVGKGEYIHDGQSGSKYK